MLYSSLGLQCCATNVYWSDSNNYGHYQSLPDTTYFIWQLWKFRCFLMLLPRRMRTISWHISGSRAECSNDEIMEGHGGAVPESLRKPRSCGMQATTWYGIGNLQATELQTTRTMPNNTKQAIQPPTLPQVPTSFKATPSSPTKTWDVKRNAMEEKMDVKWYLIVM